MKIAIIGGSGFVGSRLIESLRSKHDLINLDKAVSPFFSEITKIGDVRNSDFLNTNLQGFELVILLAAEHRDDVSPKSLYYDVNVQGTANVVKAMSLNGITRLVFTSSVAVYGLNKNNPDENHPFDPFNDYGKSKLQAEEVIESWVNDKDESREALILRPTVIFGERNRGNVYNLLKQISSGRFLMVGSGRNMKSMAYVGNIVSFIEFLIEHPAIGIRQFNYADKPDLNMNDLVQQVESSLSKKIPSFRIPFWLGMLGGYFFDTVSFLTKKRLPISSVRIKKFCATTQFDAKKAESSGFTAPFSLKRGLDQTLKFEFDSEKIDDVIFETE